MTNSKHTKRAFLSSVVALLLCFTMLMGATFAWFTDNVSSTGNRIQAGDLEVDLVMDKLDGAGYKSIAEPENDKARGDIFSEATGNGVRWEPGKTQVVYLGVRNNGNLALKYNIVLNIVDNGLAGALEYAIIDGATSSDTYTSWTDVVANANGQTAALPTGQVVAAQGGVLDEIAYDKTKTFETDYFALAIHMKEEAGNEYENKDVKIDVQVVATQKDAEIDSFGPEYDEDATYADVVVNDAAALKAAIASGEKLIGLNGTITLTESLGVSGVTFVGTTKGAAIDFGTYGISGVGNTFKNLTLDNERSGFYGGMQNSDAENTTYINCTFANGLTTYGDSAFDGCTFAEIPAGNYHLWIYDGKNFTIKNSTFKYGNRSIKIFNEGGSKDISVSISDSTFLMSDTSVLNKALIEIDDTHMDSVKVDVKNITVDGGLKAQGIYRINDGTLDTSSAKSTVTVDGITNTVATTEELKNSLSDEADTIRVSAGTYSFPASSLSAGDVIICDENTVFEGTSGLNINGATVVGATFDAGNSDTSASGTLNGTFKDCTFTGGAEGLRWCYTNAGETAVFENCVFEATSRGFHFDDMKGDVYFKKCVINGFNAYGGTGTAYFEGCTFGNDKSRYNGLNIYANTELKDCTFNYISGKTNFIDMEGTGKTLTITNCTATLDGAPANIADFVGGSQLDQNTVIYK